MAADPPSPASPSDASWTPPREFDEFQIIRPLGRGGMGQVYYGRDKTLDRDVALKFILAEDASGARRRRFAIEARAIARIHHPNVASVFRLGEVSGRPYIAYEFVPGHSLEHHPRPASVEEVLRIAKGLARGIAAAHERGVLHRDIKPGNVMLADSGEIKLVDFGIAKLADAELTAHGSGLDRGVPERSAPAYAPSETLPPETEELVERIERSVDPASGLPSKSGTYASTLLGTPQYLPPEIWRGIPSSARSDIYAFGLVLYELCAGRLPRADLTFDELARAALREELPAIRTFRPDLPEPLALVLDRAVRRDPERRFPNGRELCEVLDGLTLAPEPTSDVVPDGASRGSSVPTAPQAEHVPVETPRTRYARADGVSLAYQVFGRGEVDILLHLGWVTHVEIGWEHSALATFMQRLGQLGRVTIFDKRGTGMSDRNAGSDTLEERLDDVARVIRAVGMQRPLLVGVSDCAVISAAYAARAPDDVRGLVLCGGAARLTSAPDYPHGHDPAFIEAVQEQIFAHWGEPLFAEMEAPSMAADPAFRSWLARYLRMSASPGNAAAMMRFNTTVDIRPLLPQLRVPTLILHAVGDQIARIGGARYLADVIPGARLVELPGADHAPFGAESERYIMEIANFIAALASA